MDYCTCPASLSYDSKAGLFQQHRAACTCRVLLLTLAGLGTSLTFLDNFTSRPPLLVLCLTTLRVGSVVVVVCMVTIGISGLFNASRSVYCEACHAHANSHVRNGLMKAAKWGRLTAWWTTASMATTLLLVLTYLFPSVVTEPDEKIVMTTARVLSSTGALDALANAVSVLLLGGFVGPDLHQIARRLTQVGTQVRKYRERTARQRLTKAAKLRGGNISMLAALMNNSSPDEIFREALHHFRRVPWDVLTYDVFANGGLSMNNRRFAQDLLQISELCDFGQCDAFLSHSWHDDPEAKWAALCDWSKEFQKEHGRSPTFWLDKVCIDQNNIAQDPQCLPVFLCACNSVLVLWGPTYASRLWCILELFVYYTMRSDWTTPDMALYVKLIGNSSEVLGISRTWRGFDVRDCDAFDARDKESILHVIAKGRRGIAGFNARTQTLVRRAVRN